MCIICYAVGVINRNQYIICPCVMLDKYETVICYFVDPIITIP